MREEAYIVWRVGLDERVADVPGGAYDQALLSGRDSYWIFDFVKVSVNIYGLLMIQLCLVTEFFSKNNLRRLDSSGISCWHQRCFRAFDAHAFYSLYVAPVLIDKKELLSQLHLFFRSCSCCCTMRVFLTSSRFHVLWNHRDVGGTIKKHCEYFGCLWSTMYYTTWFRKKVIKQLCLTKDIISGRWWWVHLVDVYCVE